MTLPTLKRDKNSPLKGSIKQKLFFQIVAILLLSAALILFVNSRLLSQVYIWRERIISSRRPAALTRWIRRRKPISGISFILLLQNTTLLWRLWIPPDAPFGLPFTIPIATAPGTRSSAMIFQTIQI